MRALQGMLVDCSLDSPLSRDPAKQRLALSQLSLQSRVIRIYRPFFSCAQIFTAVGLVLLLTLTTAALTITSSGNLVRIKSCCCLW